MQPLVAFRERFAKLPPWLIMSIMGALSFAAATGGAVQTSAVNLVLVIVGAIVAVLVLAALADPFFDALGDLGENFTTVELGSSSAANIAETIIETLAILVLISGAFLLVTFALKAFRAGKGL